MYAHVPSNALPKYNDYWIKTLYVEEPAVAIVGIVDRGIVRWDLSIGIIQEV
jgi:hypothetical protein